MGRGPLLRRVRHPEGTLLVACVLLAALPGSRAGIVQEHTFVKLQNLADPMMALFYHSSEQSSRDMVRMLENVAKDLADEFPEFQFNKCDCDLSVNRAECDSSRFHGGSWLFTSTQETGIVKFISPMTEENIRRHVQHLNLRSDPRDVLSFDNEDDFFDRMDLSSSPKPAFVKFFEKWCKHSRRLEKVFERAAWHFKGRVDFVQLECSRTQDTREFCARHNVSSFPTLILFTGEEKHRHDEEERSILRFEEFFHTHIPWHMRGMPQPSASRKEGGSDGEGASDFRQGQGDSESIAKSPQYAEKTAPSEDATGADDGEHACRATAGGGAAAGSGGGGGGGGGVGDQSDLEERISELHQQLATQQARLAQMEAKMTKLQSQVQRLSELL